MESSNSDRVIVLVDMDCFYVQVEQKLCPEYENKPCAVVQYNSWKGGGIIAVNYEARAKGVTRLLRGNEAQQKCPNIHLFRVPEIRGKADLTKYREAGASVIDVLCEYSDCVERASIDEAYLDMTSVIHSRIQNTPPLTAEQLPNTFVVGWEDEDPEIRKREVQKWLQMIYEEEHLYNDRMLAIAAVIVEEMRTAVYEKTGYRCSAGIAHNKMLAKLSCGIHKPNKQTLLPQSSIQLLFKTMPIKKVRNLGGKLGRAIMTKFNVEHMGDLIDVPRSQFIIDFGAKTGDWLYNLVRGIENESVTSRQLPKSIGCGKNFPGKSSLNTRDKVMHWLKQLSAELEERLIKDQNNNRRFARLLTVNVRSHDDSGYFVVSRSCPIHEYKAEKLAHDALITINKLNTSSSDSLWKPSILSLSIVASKFEDKLDNSTCNIESYFTNSKHTGKKEELSNGGESTLSASISTEAESSSCKTVKVLNSTNLKSPRNSVNSSKSIVNFFKRKQMTETESFDDEGVNLSTNVKKTSLCEKDIDQNSFTCIILDNSNDSISKATEIDNSDDTIKVESYVEESTKNLIKKQTEPLGFFAKKLAERSEFNFDIEFETPCQDVNNELVNVESLLPETSDNMPSTSSVSDNDIHSDLDPELTKLCKQCNKRIPIWEETEHLDYHLALNLSCKRSSVMEESKVSSNPFQNHSSFLSKSSIIGKNTITSKSKGTGRKRGGIIKSSSRAKKSVQKNTLDAFMK